MAGIEVQTGELVDPPDLGHEYNEKAICRRCGLSEVYASWKKRKCSNPDYSNRKPKIGDRYRYKESAFCRIIDTEDRFGRVLIHWEGTDDVTRVDIGSSIYKLVD